MAEERAAFRLYKGFNFYMPTRFETSFLYL